MDVVDKNNFINLALKAMLAPIVRFCLRHGVKLQDLVDVAKGSFVEHAHKSLKSSGEAASTNRISLMTGVHRKDSALQTLVGSQSKKSRSLEWRILNHWENSEKYQTKRGKPRILSLLGSEGEFAEMVAEVSKELNPYSVLFELERVGAVEKSPRGVKLIHAEYQVVENLEEGFEFLSTDIDDLITAVEENLSQQPAGENHHVKTQFDSIPKSKAREVKLWLNKRSALLHKEVRKYLTAVDDSSVADSRRVRVALLSVSRIDKNIKDEFHHD